MCQFASVAHPKKMYRKENADMKYASNALIDLPNAQYAWKKMKMKTNRSPDYNRGVRDGVFLAIQEIIIMHDEPRVAEDIALSCGFTESELLKLSKRSGWKVRKVNKAIRGMRLDS